MTFGSDLQDYLRSTYFSTTDAPSSEIVALRIQQSFGIAPSGCNLAGIGFFPGATPHIARSGYSADAGAQYPILNTYSDGTYMATTAGVPLGFTYVDINENTKLYQGAGANREFRSVE